MNKSMMRALAVRTVSMLIHMEKQSLLYNSIKLYLYFSSSVRSAWKKRTRQKMIKS